MTTKLLIIGGVAGGATAAARARRLDEHAEIILFERGEHISFANCGLPYYIGEVIRERDDLFVTTPEAFRDRYNIDIRIFSEVVAIDTKNKHIEAKNLKTGEQYKETYDKIILSPGAEPVKPPFRGVDLDGIFNLRTVPDSDRIKAHVDNEKPQSAVIVGGGFIGLEMAENLVHRGVNTTIVEMLDQVMAPLDLEMAAMVHAHLKEKGVACELGQSVQSFSKKGSRIIVSTDKGHDIACDLVIVSIGIKPENRLARGADLQIGERGGIKVDATMRTSDPDIYAVGDAVEIKDFVTGLPTMTALAGPANKQGRIAADNALGRRSIFKGTMGTTVVQVFDLTVASTGATEKVLKQHNIPHLVSHTHSGSHASYYPGARTMAIKLIFSPSSGKILGGQIVGMEGVDKRIDVLATVIRGAMTVYDLEELELAYAPPYSSAKDPVNIAGFVAANILKGDLEIINWNQIGDLDRDRDVLIDLRNTDELDTSGVIKGALHIPLNELRKSLPELDKEKNYVPFCAVGLRSYIGHRILVQNGFRSRGLSGGYKTYLGAKETIMKESPLTRLWLSE
ncbi:MAG: FAD-dependent oxidoreductase [Deltaproteobacteria bacterium]|nr:MAG: FAD-dependent oxidoreductase [Deltaproteobacteria bacterium]